MIKGSSSMSSENTGEDGLPPGFRFHPTDEELVTCYLVPKVVDNRFSGRAIAEVDLNKCEPWDLPGKAKMGEKDWYFFSLRDRKYPTGLRTNRATEAGYWKATGKDKEVFKGHNTNYLIGMKKTLVFYRGRAPKGEKTNWVMHEYRLEGHLSYHQLSQNIKDEWVVCRIFHKSSGGKKTTPSLINGNFDIDECLVSRSLPALLESPSYSTRGVQNEETEFSDIANIHLCNSNFLQNDPQFNLNTRAANSMSSIFSQISSSGSFPGISPQMGFPSNPILMALAEQYSVSELNLKQCKMEPFSSGAKDNSLKFSQAEQWNMGQTRHDHQQQINVDNNGISHTQSMETHGIDPQDHTAMCLNPDQMNSAMFNQVTRSYQLDSSAEAAPTLDLDSLWAY